MKQNSSKAKLMKGKVVVDSEDFIAKDEKEVFEILEKQQNSSTSKRKRKAFEDEEFTKDEIEVLQILEIMSKEKDPEKLRKILHGNSEGASTSVNRNYNWGRSTTVFEVPAIISRPQSQSFQLTFACNLAPQPQPQPQPQANPPDLPPIQGLRDYILGCSRPIEKELQESDVNSNLNRLLLHKKQVEDFFLPLLMNGERVEDGIEVTAYDMDSKEYTLTFKKWSNKCYVLCGEWTTFFRSKGLAHHDHVTVWMFRHSETNNLCVALGSRKG